MISSMNSSTLSPITKLKKPLLRATIGLFGISAALGVFFVISAPEGEAWRILATTTLLAFFSLFTTNNLIRLDHTASHIKALAAAAIVSNLLWAAPWLFIIWEFIGSSWDGFEILWRTIWTFTILSICLTLTGSFLAMKSNSPGFHTTRTAAIVSAWLLYLYILPAILEIQEPGYLGDSWQLIAIASIVFVFCAISTPILAKLKPSKQTSNDDTYREQIRAELRAEIEAEVRAELKLEQAKHKTSKK